VFDERDGLYVWIIGNPAAVRPPDIGRQQAYDRSFHHRSNRGGRKLMDAQENKRTASDAYAAFGRGDAEGAMRNIDDSIMWIARGHNSLTGTYEGKQAVGELWGKLTSKEFSVEPHDFIAEGDKVVVLTTNRLEGETIETADVLTYNGNGKLVKFDTLADETVPDRVFAS
jgi:ketosteroid isomerase-like protein